MSNFGHCPFCNSDDISQEYNGNEPYVVCVDCGASVDGKAELWNTRAPVSVQEAAKVLLGDRDAFDRMVYVAEDIHCTGVSFNRVVGDALRAIAEGENP